MGARRCWRQTRVRGAPNKGWRETLVRRDLLLRIAVLAGVTAAAAACRHASGRSGPRVESDGEDGYESHTTTPPSGG